MTVESLANPLANSENNEISVAPQVAAAESARGITVEHFCYGVTLLIALGVRLFALGGQLYTSAEAATTWPAWLDAMALPIAGAPQPSSALLHSLQVALFWLFDGGGADTAGNLLGRLPMALVGAFMVLLPWWWRDRLGRTCALALAVLLAFDPWLIVLGRTADAAILSAGLALGALTALDVALRKPDEDRARSFAGALAAVALGLLVASGVQAWPWLLVVAAYILIAAPAGYSALVTIRNLVIFLASMVLGATTLLAQPDSLRMVSASLAAFVGRFAGSDYGLEWAALRLVADQPFLLFASIVGFIVAWRNPYADVRLRLFLTAWLTLGVLLLLAPGRTPYDLPLLGVAMAIFAAMAVGSVVEVLAQQFRQDDWNDGLLLGLVLLLLAGGALFWSTAMVWNREWSNTDGIVAIGLVVLGAALICVFAWLVSGRQALLVTIVVVGSLLFLVSFASAHKLASPALPAFPNGFFAETVYPDLQLLPEDLRTLSDRRKGDDRELPVLVINDATRTPDALLGWTLRAMRNLRFVDSWQTVATYADQTPPIVITPAEDVAVSQWNQFYLGSPYRTTVRWQPDALPSPFDHAEESQLWPDVLRPWLRWFTRREATPGVPEVVNMWATAK